jgi:predicted DNA binding protein
MWVLKIELINAKNFLCRLANKHQLIFNGYPTSIFEKNNELFVNAVGSVIGSKNNQKLFLKDLKKEKEITEFEIHKNFLMIQLKQPIGLKALYSQELIQVSPIKILPNFTQEYHLASWNRNNLVKIVNLKNKNVKINIKQFKKEKIQDIIITNIKPDLTTKQDKAFSLALENGYYKFPRQSELLTLSKKMNISISTFQAHLRKAECKIMKFYGKYSKKT